MYVAGLPLFKMVAVIVPPVPPHLDGLKDMLSTIKDDGVTKNVDVLNLQNPASVTSILKFPAGNPVKVICCKNEISEYPLLPVFRLYHQLRYWLQARQ